MDADRGLSVRRRRVAFPDHPVAPGEHDAVRGEPAGFSEAGDGVAAEKFAPIKAAVFVHAVGFAPCDGDARIGVGQSAAIDAHILA